MLIISDTNILSSFAAGDGFSLLSRLFSKEVICIPPAVHKELQIGLARGQVHLEVVLQAIDANKIQVLYLSTKEENIAQTLPRKLNEGESEAIALSQNRKARLLSNDKRAVYYCHDNGIRVFHLPNLLRLLWTRKIISQDEVKVLLKKMESVEKLTLSQKAIDEILAPNRRHSRRRKS